MSQKIIDLDNLVRSATTAPDRFRAEIGKYHIPIRAPGPGMRLGNFSSNRISYHKITHEPSNDQLLIPTQKSKILIEGKINLFRDHTQWRSYVNSLVTTDQQFLDHTFNLSMPETINQTVKTLELLDQPRRNYEKRKPMRKYEDNTKAYPNNQLLNFNLLRYPHSDESVNNIAYMISEDDQIGPNQLSIKSLIENYEQRIRNYSGSITQAGLKQRNIFILEKESNEKKESDFPFFFSSHKTSTPNFNLGFMKSMADNKKLKNIMQSLKNNITFSNRDFTNGFLRLNGKIFNGIDIMTSTSLNNFSESNDEIFLLPRNQLNRAELSERFVDQISTVKFIRELRNEIKQNFRNIEEIFESKDSNSFLLGYKIEKYIDNDATLPIQTYYTIDNNFIDTQLKYGRKYVYKTKAFIGIFGSSYSYSNLQIAETDHDDGAPSNKKYWASFDVDVVPSFQILEIQIDRHETAFIDTPTFPPHVFVHGKKDRPCVNFIMSPRFFSPADLDLSHIDNLRESDGQTISLLRLVKNLRESSHYFDGSYEVFRLDTPPKQRQDFSKGYLKTVYETAYAGNLDLNIPIEEINTDDAGFTEDIISNKKYYYAFRSISYHGTPSRMTEPLEVEIQKDSDEYKINFKRYEYPPIKDHQYEKNAKRLIRIVPNIERLLFSKELDKNNWQLDNGSLVSKAQGANKTFKIRVTSKHTGKKIDLNLTFKLNLDDTFKYWNKLNKNLFIEQ